MRKGGNMAGEGENKQGGYSPIIKNVKARETVIDFFKKAGFNVTTGNKLTPYDLIVENKPKNIGVVVRFGKNFHIRYKNIKKISEQGLIPSLFVLSDEGEYNFFVASELVK